MVLNNFYQGLWYTPKVERDSVKPSSFLLQSPSFKLYTRIGNNQEIPGVIPESIDDLLLKACIKDTLNVEGFSDYTELPVDIKHDLLEAILAFFYPDKDFYKKLLFSLDVSLDPKFSSDSWNCQKCQEKRLHRQKNCPLLDPIEFHDDTYTVTVGDEIYSVCPMLDKDYSLIQSAFEAYAISTSGFLPEYGAYGDQPILFCILEQKVRDRIKYYENKQLEATK